MVSKLPNISWNGSGKGFKRATYLGLETKYYMISKSLKEGGGGGGGGGGQTSTSYIKQRTHTAFFTHSIKFY